MSDPSGLGLSGAEGGEFGRAKTRHFGDVKAKFKVDTKGLEDLNKHFVKLNQEADKFHKLLPKLTDGTKKWADQLERAATAITSMGGGLGGAGGSTGGGYMNFQTPLNNQPAGNANAGPGGYMNLTTPISGGGAGGGGYFPGGSLLSRPGMAVGAAIGYQAISQSVQAIDDRIRQFAPTGMQMSRTEQVLRMQHEGMSADMYRAQWVDSLTGFNIGTSDDTNALRQAAATYGLQPLRQAQSIEDLRRSTGWAMTGTQATDMIMQMMQPEVNNRMTMMLGTGIIGPGGRQRPLNEVFDAAIQRGGFTNHEIAVSALTPGSAGRSRLANMGFSEDQQTAILLRATQRGPDGRPLNPEAAAESYATADEERVMSERQRDEEFYRNNIDNFKDMAANTAAVNRELQELETSLRGMIGALAETQPYRSRAGAAAYANNMVGRVAEGARAPVPTPSGVRSGWSRVADDVRGIAGWFGGGGDAVPSTPGTGSADSGVIPQNLASAVNTESWQKLHSNMKSRLIAMFRDNPRLSFGNGYRSPDLQRSMFLSRHRRVSRKTNISYDGSYWERLPGFPPTAPPGKSMHEIGLASDLSPSSQYGWIVANAARYGLQVGTSFGEPWHVQPAELPMSRSRYESQGAPWGTTPGGTSEEVDPYQADANVVDVPDEGEHGGTGGGGGVGAFITGMSVAEAMEAMYQANQGMLGLSANLANGGSVSSSTAQGEAIAQATGQSFQPGAGGALTGEQVALLASQAGLRGEALQRAIAIAYGESRFNPTATGDVSLQDSKWGPSLGLWQVRSLNAERGKGTSRDATRLHDPQFNARSMMEISGNGSNWRPWSVYTSGNYQQYMGAARTSMANANVGDAWAGEPAPASVGGSTVVHGGSSVTIAPQIHLSGGRSSHADAQVIAQEVIRILQSSEAVKALRRT